MKRKSNKNHAEQRAFIWKNKYIKQYDNNRLVIEDYKDSQFRDRELKQFYKRKNIEK